jgi:hypothetical protein
MEKTITIHNHTDLPDVAALQFAKMRAELLDTTKLEYHGRLYSVRHDYNTPNEFVIKYADEAGE